MLTREELYNYIAVASDDTDAALAKASFDVFDKYNLDTYMDMYDTLIGESEDKTSEDFIVSFRSITISTLKNLLRMQGIELSDEAIWSEVVDLSNAVFDLPQFEDKAVINNVIELGLNSQETLAELLKITAGLEVEHSLCLISQVDDGVIERLTQLSQEDLEEDISEEQKEVMQSCIETYVKYKSYLNAQPLFADMYTQSIAAMGLPIDIYFGFYMQQVISKMQPLQVEQIALDLVGIACLSAEGASNPLNAAKDLIEKITHEVGVATQISVRVTELCAGAFHA